MTSMSDKADAERLGGADTHARGADRRRSQRVPIEMWVEELAADERVFRRAGNLSEGGLHLDKTIPIPVGTHINLRFTLPGDPLPLEVQGHVVAIDPDQRLGMGVAFAAMEPATNLRIKRYLDHALTPVPPVANDVANGEPENLSKPL